ncbi:hypothetical protein EB796_005679 [Bugula neritina]|uniref:Uncharacterized protein n=1 Tax=Bugula neritina TaxID=10212 RepID=A0A7J7KBI9_BUGNE|nr:hypothetical protein EB796_005679 [Bugula neritina]
MTETEPSRGSKASSMELNDSQRASYQIFVVESFKEWYKDGDSKKHIPKPVVGVFGAIAGAASVYGTLPLMSLKLECI